MDNFKTHEEIKDLYDTGKYNIFYDDGQTKYEVSHIGSTIYCRDVEKKRGMGAINNFPVKHFYSEEKPIIEIPNEISQETDVQHEAE